MEKTKIILKGHVVSPLGSPQGQDVLEVWAGRIVRIEESGGFFPGPDHQMYDFGACYICPGFIDMHIHGAGGADVMDGTQSALETISRAAARGGTTAFLATTASGSKEKLSNCINTVADVMKQGTGGALIAGIHLEGPFLNPHKKGALDETGLRTPDIAELRHYIAAGQGAVRMLTIAPELPGALDVIRYAASRGFIVSMGHTEASICHVTEACQAGLTHVSHAFNAMGGFHHRDPGTTGAIMSMKELSVDVIPDGHHVHPNVIKILVLAKGIDMVCGITDSTRATQMGDGIYELGGQQVIVRDGLAHLADGTLAGSTITMAKACEVLVEQVGLTMAEAVTVLSTNPAKLLGLEGKGMLLPGRDADITVLDRDYRVLMTLVGGRVVYRRE